MFARVSRNEVFFRNRLAHLGFGYAPYETKILQILAPKTHGFIIGGDPWISLIFVILADFDDFPWYILNI